MAQQNRVNEIWKIIRLILEEIGVLESAKEQLQNRVRQLSAVRSRGPASVVVKGVGDKQRSAISAIRQVSGLSTQEALKFINLLPAPLLIHVDEKTAVAAGDHLTSRGLIVSVVGIPIRTVKPKEVEPAESLVDLLNIIDVEPTPPPETPVAELPAASWPEPEQSQPDIDVGEGEYVVVLERAGLLTERIESMLPQIAAMTPQMAAKLMSVLPQPILIGVDQATAHKAQSQLQMFGAVVEVTLWELYEKQLEKS